MLNSEKAKIVTPMLIAMQMQKRVDEQTNYYWDYIKSHQTIDYTLRINDTYTYKIGHFVTDDPDICEYWYNPVGYHTQNVNEIVIGNYPSTGLEHTYVGAKEWVSPPYHYLFLFETINLYKNGDLIATWFNYFDPILQNYPSYYSDSIYKEDYNNNKYYIKGSEVSKDEFNSQLYSLTPHEIYETWWYYDYSKPSWEETSNFTAGTLGSTPYLNCTWNINVSYTRDNYRGEYISGQERYTTYPAYRLVYNRTDTQTYTRRETSVYLYLSSSNPIYTFTPLTELQQDIKNIQKYIYEEIEYASAPFDVKMEDAVKVIPSE